MSKFYRIIAFTDIELTDKYAALLTIKTDAIQVLGQIMPITIIQEWEVSIRPCEFNNFAQLFGMLTKVESSSREYHFLMGYLTNNHESLLSLLEMPDNLYQAMKSQALSGIVKPKIFPALDYARQIVQTKLHGQNIIRYLMLRMNNQIIKAQYNNEQCNLLSNLRLSIRCNPFETMPFCNSPIDEHNPRYWDLVESLDHSNREHELLARRITSNNESYGKLYTPTDELASFEDIDALPYV